MLPLIFLLSTVLLVAPVQPKPIHNLNEPHLKAAKRIGFLEDAFERLHLTELSEILDGGIHHPLNISRIKERQGSQVETILHIPLAELQLKLSLKHPEQILHENAKIVVSNGEEEQHFIVEPRNCYLVGRIDGYSGSASLSYCNGLRGSVVLGDTEYTLEPVDDGARHIVGEHRKQDKHSFVDKVNEAYAFEDDKRVVTVEMALYNDAEMTKMLDAKGFDTLHKKIDYIVSKFNGVQYEYTKTETVKGPSGRPAIHKPCHTQCHAASVQEGHLRHMSVEYSATYALNQEQVIRLINRLPESLLSNDRDPPLYKYTMVSDRN